jgi:Bacterial toxin 44
MPTEAGTADKLILASRVTQNARTAATHRQDDISVKAAWFAFMVREGGPWDYKRNGNREYEKYGNYHYGYTGAAVGFSLDTLLRTGGGVQIVTSIGPGGTRFTPSQGTPLGGAPYGDQPEDGEQVRAGFNDYLRCQN